MDAMQHDDDNYPWAGLRKAKEDRITGLLFEITDMDEFCDREAAVHAIAALLADYKATCLESFGRLANEFSAHTVAAEKLKMRRLLRAAERRADDAERANREAAEPV